MKILQLIQKEQLRGAEVFACQLSNHLVEMGHEVNVVALAEGTTVLPFKGSVEQLGARLNKRFFDFNTWKQLAAVIRHFQPDIVQANAGDTLKYAVLSKFFFGWKQPIVFRNASMMSLYVKNGFVRWFNQQLLERSAHVAAVSAFTKQDLIQNLKVAPEKISVLPVGVEPIEVRPVAMDPSQVHIVHVGGFSFEKNHKGLLRIFQQVHQQVPQCKLWLVGDGKLMEEIKATVREMQLQDVVVFTGNVNNPLDYIAAADVLVLPSIIEGLPAVVAEAFQCKTPVVAYDTGGIRELVNEQTGWLVPKGDESIFATTVVELLGSTSIGILQKTTAAYELLQQRFTNKKIAVVFAEMYAQLL